MMKQSRHEEIEYRPFPNEEGRNTRQAELEVPALVWALDLPPKARILEVGCGRGVALPVLAELCEPTRLVGLDIEVDFLLEAADHLEEQGAEADLYAGDVREMPFADGEFDVVIDFGTLYHIARPQEALDEITRVLAPGGRFVYETRASQLLSHPVRSRGRTLPRLAARGLRHPRWAMLWASRVKVSPQPAVN